MRKSGVSGRPLISVVAQSRCQSGEHSASGGRVGVARGVLSAIWKSKSGSIAIKIAARSSYGYGGSPDLPDTPAPTHAHAPTLHRNSIYIYDALLATGARGGDRLAQPNASHYVGLGAGGQSSGGRCGICIDLLTESLRVLGVWRYSGLRIALESAPTSRKAVAAWRPPFFSASATS